MEASGAAMKVGMATMLFGLLILVFNSPNMMMASAQTCANTAVNIQPCIPVLNGTTPTPSNDCCLGLASIQSFEATVGVFPTCNCTKTSLINFPGVVVTVGSSINVQNNCSVSLGFSLATTDAC